MYKDRYLNRYDILYRYNGSNSPREIKPTKWSHNSNLSVSSTIKKSGFEEANSKIESAIVSGSILASKKIKPLPPKVIDLIIVFELYLHLVYNIIIISKFYSY